MLQQPTDRKLNAFYHFQQLFSRSSILAHYNPTWQLYNDLDASKAFGFVAVVCYSKNDESSSQKNVDKTCPIPDQAVDRHGTGQPNLRYPDWYRQ